MVIPGIPHYLQTHLPHHLSTYEAMLLPDYTYQHSYLATLPIYLRYQTSYPTFIATGLCTY